MRLLSPRRLILVLGVLVLGVLTLLIAPVAPHAAAITPELTVWHKPPGLLLRGEPVTLRVSVQTDPSETVFEGEAYVRGDPLADFTRIPRLLVAASLGPVRLDSRHPVHPRYRAGARSGSFRDIPWWP